MSSSRSEMHGGFDPAAVPPFPVFTIRQTDAGDTLDGVPIEPAHGETDRHRAATDAAAQKAAEQGHEAVRVRAHLSDGRSVDFVVRASGEVYDTTVPDEPVKPSRKKRALILVAAGLTGVLVIGGGAFVLGHALGDEEPVAVETAPPPPAGAGTDIPVGLPPAFSRTAAWSAQVDDKAVVRELSDGRLLTITEARTLTILDPDRGEPQWVGSSAPTDLTDVHETTWQGRPVLAAASSQSLTLWPLDDTEGTVAPVSVDLDARAEVTYAGTAPLIDLGDYTVTAPATESSEAHRVTLPPGAVPAAAGADGVIRSLTDEAVWTTNPDTGEHERIDLATPEGADGAPEDVIGLTADHALVQWSGDGSSDTTLALIDLTTGTVAAQATARPPSDSDVLHSDPDAQTAVIGDVFISYGDDPAVVDLDGLDVTAVDGRQLYGSRDRTAVTATVTGDETSVEDYPLYSPDDPSPVLVSDDAAYVVHTTVDETYLYRADRTPSKETP